MVQEIKWMLSTNNEDAHVKALCIIINNLMMSILMYCHFHNMQYTPTLIGSTQSAVAMALKYQFTISCAHGIDYDLGNS